MASFRFVGVDGQGRRVEGTVRGASPGQAMANLKKRGLRLENLVFETSAAPLWTRLRPGAGPAHQELAGLYRQLATLFAAGIPLVRCLETLQRGQWSPLLSFALEQSHRALGAGLTLSSAMDVFPGIFSGTARGMVAVAESSGTLGHVLEHLAQLSEREANLRRRLSSALVYPAFLLGLALLLSAALALWFLPRLSPLMLKSTATGTWARSLWSLLASLADPLWLVVVVEAALVAALAIYLTARSAAGRRAWDRIQLQIPALGRTLRAAALARLSLSLMLLQRSGIPPLGALRMLAETPGLGPWSPALLRVRRRLSEGNTLTEAFRPEPDFAEGPFLQLLGAGEESGNLEPMYAASLAYYQESLEFQLQTLTALLEPLIICVMGLLVGGVLCLFLPAVYQTMRSVT